MKRAWHRNHRRCRPVCRRCRRDRRGRISRARRLRASPRSRTAGARRRFNHRLTQGTLAQRPRNSSLLALNSRARRPRNRRLQTRSPRPHRPRAMCTVVGAMPRQSRRSPVRPPRIAPPHRHLQRRAVRLPPPCVIHRALGPRVRPLARRVSPTPGTLPCLPCQIRPVVSMVVSIRCHLTHSQDDRRRLAGPTRRAHPDHVCRQGRRTLPVCLRPAPLPQGFTIRGSPGRRRRDRTHRYSRERRAITPCHRKQGHRKQGHHNK